jgi:aryl-alcohol dehydrogenase-like predicted oxidoreductase
MSLPLTLGTAQLGMPYGVANTTGRPDRSAALGILAEALRLGITSFDTAPVYGDAEELLGEFTAGLPAGPPMEIVTKVPPLELRHDAAPEEAVGRMLEAVERSRSRLRLARLGTVLFHRASDFAWRDRLLPAALLEHGAAGAVGVSVYSPSEALDAIAWEGTAALQVPTNLLDLRFIRAGVFERAAARGVRVFVRSVYLQGLLLMPAPAVPPPLRQVVPLRERALALTEEDSVATATFALLKALPGSPPIIVAAERLEQLRNTVSAYAAAVALPPSPFTRLLDDLGTVPERIVNPSLWAQG